MAGTRSLAQGSSSFFLGVVVLIAALCLSPFSYGLDWSGEFTQILQQLKSNNLNDRINALNRLERYPIKQIKKHIITALDDSEIKIATEAARIASQYKFSEAIPIFLRWLSHWDKEHREAAAMGLKKMGDPSVIHVLVRSLGDPESSVRLKVVTALSSIHTKDKAEVIPLMMCLNDSSSKVRLVTVQALEAKKDPRALIPLIGRLHDSSNEVRRAAVVAIAALKDPGTGSLLLRLINDRNAKVAAAAIEALGELKVEGATPALLALIKQKSDLHTELIATALGKIGTPSAFSALSQMLSNHLLAPHAEKALKLSINTALPYLLKELRGPQTPIPVALSIVRILQETHTKAAVSALIHAVREGRIPRLPLVIALGRIGDSRAQRLLLELLTLQNYQLKIAILEALEKIADERSADPLLVLLKDPQFQVKLLTIRMLGKLRSKLATKALLGIALKGKGALAREAILALASIRDPLASNPLIGLLRSSDRAVRRAVSQTLANIQDQSSIKALMEICTDAEPALQVTCIQTLGGVLRGRSDDLVLEFLFKLINQNDRSLLLAAIDALGAMKDPRINPVLIRRFPSLDLPVQRKLLYALGNYSKRSPPTLSFLLEALRSDEPSLQSAAAWALAKIRDPAALPALKDAAINVNPDLRINVAAALAQLNSPLTIKLLRTLVKDANPYVRANALLGLAWADKNSKVEIFETRLSTDRSPWVRMNALRAIQFLHPAEVRFPANRILSSMPQLIATIIEEDPDPSVREMAKNLTQKDPYHQATWISLFLLNPAKQPLRDSRFLLVTPSGLIKADYSDSMGESWEEEITPGYCHVELPNR